MNPNLDQEMKHELDMLNTAKSNFIWNYDNAHKHIHYSDGHYTVHDPRMDKGSYRIEMSLISPDYFGTIGSRIRKLREEQKLSQIELSKRSKISLSSISAYETDQHIPSVENCIKLADALTTSLNYLILGIY